MLRTTVLAAAAALCLPATALAAPGWTPTETAATLPWAHEVHAALGDEGTVGIAWDGDSKFVAGERAPGGAFTFTDPVASWDGDIDGDAAGTLTAAWAVGDTVEVVTRPAGGDFGAPQQLATVGAGALVDVSPNGTTVVAWRGASGFRARVRLPKGTFGPELVITEASPNEPQIAVSDEGEVVALWETSQMEWLVKVRPPGGTFPAEPQELGNVREADLAMNDRGDAQIVFLSYDDEGVRRFGAAHRSAGEPFTVVPDVSDALNSAGEPVAGVAPDGDGLIAWAADHVVTIVDRHGDTYGEPAEIATEAYDPVVTFDVHGAAFLAWVQENETNTASTLQVARRAPGAGEFGAPKGLGDGTRWIDDPVLRANGQGDVLATWLSEGEDDMDVQFAVYDGEAPASDPGPKPDPKPQPTPGGDGVPAGPAPAPESGAPGQPPVSTPATPRSTTKPVAKRKKAKTRCKRAVKRAKGRRAKARKRCAVARKPAKRAKRAKRRRG